MSPNPGWDVLVESAFEGRSTNEAMYDSTDGSLVEPHAAYAYEGCGAAWYSHKRTDKRRPRRQSDLGLAIALGCTPTRRR